MVTALDIQPLTREAFAPFGDVIETDGAAHFTINAGFAERFHDLANVDVAAQGGRPLISIFRGQPRAAPFRLTLMERHPLGTQAFVPLQDHAWIIVVAAGADPCRPDALRAFRAGGRQGVNYARGTWHHPLIVLAPDHEFLVIDRGDGGNNLEEVPFPDASDIVLNGLNRSENAEQEEKNNDRNGDSDQPKQSTLEHDDLLVPARQRIDPGFGSR